MIFDSYLYYEVILFYIYFRPEAWNSLGAFDCTKVNNSDMKSVDDKILESNWYVFAFEDAFYWEPWSLQGGKQKQKVTKKKKKNPPFYH